MNLYTFIFVEPKDRIPQGAVAGGERMLILGGLPKGETDGPWREDQSAVIDQVVKVWYRNVPDNATPAHKKQRSYARKGLDVKDYGFHFSFQTGDAINLDCYQLDTRALYTDLHEACEDTDMVVTKFDSV